MIHLQSIKKVNRQVHNPKFPFDTPIIEHFRELELTSPVTILVGENGSGKSTLLETIALNSGSIWVGSDRENTSLSQEVEGLLKMSWKVKTQRGFYFRASDFNLFIHKLKEEKRFSLEMIEEIKREGRNQLETMPYARTLADLQRLYGEGLEHRSHGESFLDLFQARFKENSFYILDEPEAPLSPQKQLSFLSLLKQMVSENGQFLIATHSPMIMAFPGATIYQVEGGQLVQTSYEELEHVTITRDFLQAPERFFRYL